MIEYLERDSSSPFGKWFTRLNAKAGAKVATVLYRLERGNISNVKSVGKGVFEYRIDFGQESDALVILLGGGTKKRQSKDIGNAQKLWAEYKSRKKRR